MSARLHVPTGDDRTIEVLDGGDAGRTRLLFHGGSPSAVAESQSFDDAVRAAGLRLVTYSRPGWLAEHVPHAEGHLFDDENHLSLITQLGRILADPRRLSALGPAA